MQREHNGTDSSSASVTAGDDLQEGFTSSLFLSEAVADEGAKHVGLGRGGGVVAGGDDGFGYSGQLLPC